MGLPWRFAERSGGDASDTDGKLPKGELRGSERVKRPTIEVYVIADF